MDWDHVWASWKELSSRARESWEKLAREPWQERRHSRERERERAAAVKEAQQHVKHFEDMH